MRSVRDLVAYIERMSPALSSEPVPVSPDEYEMLVQYYHDQQRIPQERRMKLENMRLMGHPLEVLK